MATHTAHPCMVFQHILPTAWCLVFTYFLPCHLYKLSNPIWRKPDPHCNFTQLCLESCACHLSCNFICHERNLGQPALMPSFSRMCECFMMNCRTASTTVFSAYLGSSLCLPLRPGVAEQLWPHLPAAAPHQPSPCRFLLLHQVGTACTVLCLPDKWLPELAIEWDSMTVAHNEIAKFMPLELHHRKVCPRSSPKMQCLHETACSITSLIMSTTQALCTPNNITLCFLLLG